MGFFNVVTRSHSMSSLGKKRKLPQVYGKPLFQDTLIVHSTCRNPAFANRAWAWQQMGGLLDIGNLLRLCRLCVSARRGLRWNSSSWQSTALTLGLSHERSITLVHKKRRLSVNAVQAVGHQHPNAPAFVICSQWSKTYRLRLAGQSLAYSWKRLAAIIHIVSGT